MRLSVDVMRAPRNQTHCLPEVLRRKKLYGVALLCGLIVLTLLATRRCLRFADYGNDETVPFDSLLQEPATAQAYPSGKLVSWSSRT